MRKSDFAYHLPAELIAQRPSAVRSGSRLLVIDTGAAGSIVSAITADLGYRPAEGELVVTSERRILARHVRANSRTHSRLTEDQKLGAAIKLLRVSAYGGNRGIKSVAVCRVERK